MIEHHDRRTMAEVQLETALMLYLDRRDYYSATTLAGAADEIFGKLLAVQGVDNQLESIKKNVEIVQKWLGDTERDVSWVARRANLARNALKHWDEGQPMLVEFDAAEEARDMLDRAITNLWRLGGIPSALAERYLAETRDTSVLSGGS